MARPASDISERVVHAARERFLNEGVDGASLRNIAQDAGTNIGMIYYYFKTKDDLFLAVVEEVYSIMLADLTVLLSADEPSDQRIRRVYQRIASMNEVEFKVLRLIMREAMISSVRLSRLVKRFETGHLPLVFNMLRDGMAQGVFRTDLHPLALMAATFSCGIMPQLLHRLISQSSLPVAKLLPPATEAADQLGNILLQGLKPSTSAGLS